ncbi:MAG: PA14 domain-containing protein [Anaerolineae bacterium]
MKTRILLALVLVAILFMGTAAPSEASSCQPVYHTVKAGQNLTQIARLYGVTVNSIVKANNLWNANIIYVGQRLLIPVPCPTEPSTGCTAIHVVKRGEYLKVIAARYGTTVAVLVNLNGIKNPNLIYPGQRLKVPTKCTTPPTPSTGKWQGQYWNNRNLAGSPQLTRKDKAVNFNWGTGGPGDGIHNDNFSARWTRTIEFKAGYYRFHVWADDGVRLWLDGQLLIDEWHDTPLANYWSETKYLSGKHNVRIEYYEHLGGAHIGFEIKTSQAPGGPKKPGLKADALWKGEYYPYRTWESCCPIVRYEPKIFFDWGSGSPFPGYREDDFNVRWTRNVYFDKGRFYFTIEVDDGVILTIDGDTVLSAWYDTNGAAYTVYYDIPKAGVYPVKIEYYEATGNAKIKITVNGPYTTW